MITFILTFILEDFSTIDIFNAPEDLPKPMAALGPFISSKDIKLNKGELKLLSKDPKYSLIYPPDRMKVALEIERMNAKIRYGDSATNNSTTKNTVTMPIPSQSETNRITDPGGNPIDWHGSRKKMNKEEERVTTVEEEVLNDLKLKTEESEVKH